ncbi:holo-ACP synthase [Streptomyces pinistramenti]|uniref:holo-ACP synthase n=1 Tax=Streptomyces pinistramenti TaxID=2884812 RepID=UPI001D0743DD|nr:4'-phosphopantetheinyl transferase superfamily protein [Streptomyces pinistramenti]MCB5907564.1 4'-phosphopantetheinyl transferase superfamily protein [Streptomyces pinistramenti]
MIRVGVDLVPVARVQAMADAGDSGPLHLMLTSAEAELSRFATGWDLHGVAGRIAAKEAVFKLLHVADRTLPWQSIEVLKTTGKWPTVRLSEPASTWAAEAGIEAIDVSISHEDQFAVAVAAGAAGFPTDKETFHAEHHLVQR